MAGTAGYFGYDYVHTKKMIRNLDRDIVVLYSAASDGLFEQSMLTTSSKIDRICDKHNAILKSIEMNYDEDQSIKADKLLNIVGKLNNRLRLYELAQRAFEIKDPD